MKRLVLPLLFAACAAPESATGPGTQPPEIKLIYPDYDDELSFMVDEQGDLDLFVVVDLIDIEFVAPSLVEDVPNDPATGHWHLFANESNYLGSPANLYEDTSTGAFTPGEPASITVDLRNNDHSAYVANGCVCTAVFEFEVQAFEAGSSSNRETPKEVLDRLEEEGFDLDGLRVLGPRS